MAQTNVLKRYLDAGAEFTSMTQAKAEALVKDLVHSGELQTEQVQDAVTELLERSRQSTERLVELIRKEVSAQADALGLASRADLHRLEKMVTSLLPGSSAKKAAAKKAPAKKAAAKKAPAKKAAKRAG